MGPLWKLWRLYKFADDLTNEGAKKDSPVVTSICLGMLTGGVLAWVLAGLDETRWLIRIMFVSWLFIAGGGVLIGRLWRPFKGRSAIPPERCTRCKSDAPLSPARYLRHAGMFIYIYSHETNGFYCRRCHLRLGAWWTVSTLVVGWWSLLSVFIAPAVILHNVLFILRSRLPWRFDASYAKRQVVVVLEENADYVRNLMASKSIATAAEVLAARTKLPVGIVAQVLERRWQRIPGLSDEPGTPPEGPYR